MELDNAISDFYAPQIEKEMFVRKAIKIGKGDKKGKIPQMF